MKTKIVNFINILRKTGIRVSVSESLDAINSIHYIDVLDKDSFKYTLRSTLIKEERNFAVFEQVFNLFFQNINSENNGEEIKEEEFLKEFNELKDFLDKSEEDFDFAKECDVKSQNIYDDMIKNKIPIINEQDIKNQLLKSGDNSDFVAEAEKISENCLVNKNNVDSICNKIMKDSGYLNQKTSLIKETKNELEQEIIEENYNFLKQCVKEQLNKSLVNKHGTSIISDLVQEDNIMDFDLINIKDYDQVVNIIKKMAKKISTHVLRKHKRATKGDINLSKTIKKSISYGTASSHLCFKKKKKQKTRLVVLCDVSGSVCNYVPFMLSLVCGIQGAFEKVESYVFIDHIQKASEVEFDDDFKYKLDYSKLGMGTDYGNVFYEISQVEKLFNKKTIFIIFGDAENTGKEIGDNYLKNIHQQCKAIIWLNPNDPIQWHSPMSQYNHYQPYCVNCYTCKTLNDLQRFVKDLIKI